MAPLERREDQIFNGDEFSTILESALTHGAFDADLDLWGDVGNIFYATLRYPGHFEKVRTMLKSFPREECVRQLKEKMGPSAEDVIVLRVKVSGKGSAGQAVFAYELVDFYDPAERLTAMQRCTAFPAAETLLQIIGAGNWPRGVIHHERYIDIDLLIANLARHGLKIKTSLTAKGAI